MSERKQEKSVTVESQGHANGAPATKSTKGDGRNLDETRGEPEKKSH